MIVIRVTKNNIIKNAENVQPKFSQIKAGELPK